MISGLVFTTFMSTNFGTNIKAWRLFADGIVDVGITLEASRAPHLSIGQHYGAEGFWWCLRGETVRTDPCGWMLIL